MHRSTHARLKHYREQVIAVQPQDLNGTLGGPVFLSFFLYKDYELPQDWFCFSHSGKVII